MPTKVVVVGAGIIGVSCAFELHRCGFDVVVVDPGTHESAASLKNAGALAFTEILPIASGHILRKVPRWLTDPTGPLSIKLRHLPGLLPWLFRFLRTGTQHQQRVTAHALGSLNVLSRRLYPALYKAAGLQHAVRNTGALHLYESAAEFNEAKPAWELRQEQGLRFRHVDQSELLAMEPALTPSFTAATFIEDWCLVSDPKQVLCAIRQLNIDLGVRFVQSKVAEIRPSEGEICLRLTGNPGSICADKVVIAAGAWSGKLARQLGDKVPVEAERGYNTTLRTPGISITRELIFGAHGFVATQLDCGLRIGGGAEFAGLDEPPNFKRAQAMMRKARRFLPGLADKDSVDHGAEQWMGCRPAMPDSVPVIGPSRCSPQILYAFGHGHTGLTQSSGTARLIADMVSGRQSEIETQCFSATRFN